MQYMHFTLASASKPTFLSHLWQLFSLEVLKCLKPFSGLYVGAPTNNTTFGLLMFQRSSFALIRVQQTRNEA
jgi:hypothetical protein